MANSPPGCKPLDVSRTRPLYAGSARWIAGAMAVLGFAVFLVVLCPYAKTPAGLRAAPPSVRSLAASLPGKPWWLMRAGFMLRFGTPDRDVGSGVYIEEWDLPEGTLRLHSGFGPTFTAKSTGQTMSLLHTANPVGVCLQASFSLRFGPREHYGGTIELRPDSTYIHDGKFFALSGVPRPGFSLLDHPVGKFRLHLGGRVTAETLLETLPDGTVIAHIEFQPEDGSPETAGRIVADHLLRGLRLESVKPGEVFSGIAPWKDYGKKRQ